MDGTELENARVHKGDGLLRSGPPLGTATARRTIALRLVLAAGTIGLLGVLLLTATRCAGNIAAPPQGSPTATPIEPIVAEQMTATAVASDLQTLEQRPLQLPVLAPGSSCPVTPGRIVSPSYGPAAGSGPAYAVGIRPDGTLPFIDAARWAGGGTGTAWGGQKVVWAIKDYQGAILIRGRQLDGAQAVEFNGGLDQATYQGNLATAPLLPELRLQGDEGLPWTNWGSNVRMKAPGCFGLQVDALSFHETIVFRAVMT